MLRSFLSFSVIVLFVPASRADDERPLPREVIVLEQTVQQAIERAEPSIACIAVSRSERYREFEPTNANPIPGRLGKFDARIYRNDPRANVALQLDLSLPDHVPESYGSGVVIDASGLVLTNYHVVRDATKIFIRLPNRIGCYADVHAADARADLAVLRMLDMPRNVTALPLGDGSKLRKGSWIISLANPFSAGFRDGSPSAAWGIVSNLRRRAPVPGDQAIRIEQRIRRLSEFSTLIQTDARLNLGCSGGALINLEGELVGLTTSIAALVGGETAGGYAVPIDAEIAKIIEVLRQGREVEYGFLGVSVAPPSPFVTETRGISLNGVTPGSPAANAGLRENDVILKINNKPIREYDDLFLHIASALAGSEIEVEAMRNGQVRKVVVTLAKFSHPLTSIASNRGPSVHGLRVDYTSVLLDGGQRQFPHLPTGVLLRELEPGSIAETKLKPLLEGNARWIITKLNGQPVSTPAEFFRIADKAKRIELTLVDPTRPEMSPRIILITG